MEKSLDDPLPSDSGERTFEIMSKVFGLEELREKILDYVIHDEKGVVVSDVRLCRLVNKTWLRSTSSVLSSSGEPLFRFHLRERNSWDPQHNEKPLDQFVKAATGRQFLDGRVPPHAVRVNNCDIFEKEKYQNFFDCLVDCGEGLVKLDLQFPTKGHLSSIPLTNYYSFPKLQFLSVRFQDSYKPTDDLSADIFNKRIDFVQSVFDASERLKFFKFSYVPSGNYPPNNFGNLKYPTSLTNLILEYVGNDNTLLALARTSLPHLKTLTLYVNGIPYNDGLITSILDNVRKTLKCFSVWKSRQPRNSGRPRSTTFQLPLMEKLETLMIGTRYVELEGDCASLEKLVPVLNYMRLTEQTVTTIRKWTEKSCFSTVNSLEASLIPEIPDPEHEYENFDMGTMATLNMAFPNLTTLNIVLDANEMPASILWEMRKLEHLEMRVFVRDEDCGLDICESLLIGSFALMHDTSIRDLSNLQTLWLGGTKPFSARRDSPLISEDAFHSAFLKMPKLTKLELFDCFCTTREMAKLWEKQGGTIRADFYEDYVEVYERDRDVYANYYPYTFMM